jgi:hypothetical protein
MPTRKKPARRPTAASKSTAAKAKLSRAAKTQALAITEAVKREPLQVAAFAPTLMLEPLRRTMVNGQLALLSMMTAWSPTHMIVRQQAAFWEGFASPDSEPKAPPRKRTAAKRARKK